MRRSPGRIPAWRSVLSRSIPANSHHWEIRRRDRLRQRANLSAQSFIPPSRLINCTSDSDGVFCTRAYRSTRDHLDRVLLSTFAGSEVERTMAANGSSSSNGVIFRNRTALCVTRSPRPKTPGADTNILSMWVSTVPYRNRSEAPPQYCNDRKFITRYGWLDTGEGHQALGPYFHLAFEI
jgi:hypothetical protein